MYFLIADELLIFDRVDQTITILVNALLGGRAPEEAYEEAVGEIERLVALLWSNRRKTPRWTCRRETPEIPFTSNVAKEAFLQNDQEARQKIHHRQATLFRW